MILFAIYIVGGLLACGMLIGEGIFSFAIQDIKEGYDFWDKFKTNMVSCGTSAFVVYELLLSLGWKLVLYIKNQEVSKFFKKKTKEIDISTRFPSPQKLSLAS